MIGFLLRVAALLAIYLLVLTSLAPGDVLLGSALAVALVAATHPRHGKPAAGWRGWAVAVVRTVVTTGRELLVGTIRTIRFCLGWPASPGFVEIPRGDRSRREVALWGVLTGEAPDEYPVEVDDGRGVLVVHILDAHDPAAIRARHEKAHQGWLRHVVE